MDFSNRERVGRGLDAVRAGLIPYVRAELIRLYGMEWLPKARASLRTLPYGAGAALNLDVPALIAIVLDPAHTGFTALRRPADRGRIFEIRAARNGYAHQEEFSDRETDRALDTMELVLEAVDSEEVATVQKLRQREVPVATMREPVSRGPVASKSVTSKPIVPAMVGVLAPDTIGHERGVKLFRFLAEAANRGLALGVGYAVFIEFLHNKPFDVAMGRPYAQSDTGMVIGIAEAVTGQANRIRVTRGATSIDAGMDTFIWPLKKPHERSSSAWKNGLPYTKEQWQRVFPDHLRKLMSAEELKTRIGS